jgi:hypothetical protein
MTRRLLLLLESDSISASESKQVYDRVISGILYRYVEEDASFVSGHEKKSRIPRFLLNDVVRFWRTMAVDSRINTELVKEQSGHSAISSSECHGNYYLFFRAIYVYFLGIE